MGFFSLSWGNNKSATTTSDKPAQWLIDWVRGGKDASLTGVSVTPDSMMQLSAVFTCVRIRSEDMGKLPCILYRRLTDANGKSAGKQRAVDHPAFSLMRFAPNPYQTAMEFKQLLQAWVDTRGNGYALKEFDARGQVVALWPLNPTWVTVLYVPGTWERFYRVAWPRMDTVTYPAEAILHLRGMTLDGFMGLSPVAYHRETIGLGLAAERYGAAFFGNSAQPNGALKVPHVLDKPAADTLRAQWEEKYKGVDNRGKLAIFDGGMEWVQTGMNNTDAEYLATRKFQNHQVYGLYRMPPHKAGDIERSTNNNIEQQSLEYVTDCLLTEMVRWEQTLWRSLLSEEERKTMFFEYMPDMLLRGDQKSRYEAYAIGRNWGWLNADEIRDKENMNPLPDGKGAVYLQPLNMAEAGTKPPPISAPSPGGAKYLLELATLAAAAEEARANPNLLNGHNGAHHG